MIQIYPWQREQWAQLSAAREQGRLPHALLLAGAEGLGLRQFAYALGAGLLCPDTDSSARACGICKSCTLLQAGNHPDFLSIEPEETGKQIKVEQIRQLGELIARKSHYDKGQVVIINPADAMNQSSANGLLKTLEEPPGNSLLLLVSSRAALLPVTIRSRCQRLGFSGSYDDDTVAWLTSRIQDTGIIASEILRKAGGLPLKALELTESDVIQRQDAILEDLQNIRQNADSPVKIAEKWNTMGAEKVFGYLIELFWRLSRLKLGQSDNNSSEHRHLQGFLKGLDLLQILKCYDLVLKHYNTLSGTISLNKQGLLEDFIISWQSLGNSHGG